MKIKAIAILTAIIIIVSYVPVYADTTIPPLPTDRWEYWMIAEVGATNTYIHLYTSHNPIKAWKPDNKKIRMDTYKYYRLTENGWVLQDEGLGQLSFYTLTVYASNHDIPYEEGSDDFFFVRPKVSPLIQTMEITDFGTILRNFSAGLIPVLGLLILGISLAKAWGFLRTQLMS